MTNRKSIYQEGFSVPGHFGYGLSAQAAEALRSWETIHGSKGGTLTFDQIEKARGIFHTLEHKTGDNTKEVTFWELLCAYFPLLKKLDITPVQVGQCLVIKKQTLIFTSTAVSAINSFLLRYLYASSEDRRAMLRTDDRISLRIKGREKGPSCSRNTVNVQYASVLKKLGYL